MIVLTVSASVCAFPRSGLAAEKPFVATLTLCHDTRRLSNFGYIVAREESLGKFRKQME